MRTSLRAALLAAASLPGAAWAQSAGDNQTTAPSTVERDGTGSQALATDVPSQNDILVTARRVEERLQDAPSTIAVTTAATIDRLGLDNLSDIARLTVSVAKLRPFIVAEDWRPTAFVDKADLKPLVAPRKQQLELFAA